MLEDSAEDVNNLCPGFVHPTHSDVFKGSPNWDGVFQPGEEAPRKQKRNMEMGYED